MKKRWKLSRGKRTIINLALSTLLLVLIWGLMDYPLPTAEMEFRRMERTHLLPHSEIQGIFLDGCRNRTWQTVGVQEDRVVLLESRNLSEGGSIMSIWPGRTEGATLVPIPWNGSEFEKERDIVAVDVPEGTASARLEAEVSCWYSKVPGGGWELRATENGTAWSKHYQAEGELLEEGGVLFRISPQGDTETEDGNIEWLQLRRLSEKDTYHQPGESRVNARLEAVFYDKDGGELGRAVLCTPEG